VSISAHRTFAILKIPACLPKKGIPDKEDGKENILHDAKTVNMLTGEKYKYENVTTMIRS